MKKFKMITMILVVYLTMCGQVMNSMTEISNISTFDDFEIVNCSIEIEAEVSCGSVVSGTTIGATKLLIISF